MVVKLLKEIEYNNGEFPKEILLEVIARREEAVPELLSILEYTCNNAEQLAGQDNYFAHIYALYLLAQFRVKSAYPLICNLLNKPNEILDDLLDGVIVEGIPSILASVYDGNIDLLKNIIENKQIDEYVRSATLHSLIIMVGQGIITRDEVIAYFKILFEEKLERNFSHAWNGLVGCSYEIYPEELLKNIELAYKDNLVDPFYISLKDVRIQLEDKKENVLEKLQNSHFYQLINDTIHELEGWACFHDDDYSRIDWSSIAELNIDQEINKNKRQKQKQNVSVIQAPLSNQNKIGRNEPCPCGSGKKYKKCCG